MTVVIPMAGRGSRFADRGFITAKPLIPVAGRPMLYWALRSLGGMDRSQTIFIALVEHERQWNVTKVLNDLVPPPVHVILIPEVTEGQLCTVLAARDFINTKEDVLIAASDTLVVSNLGAAIANRNPNCHGIISVADMPGEQWSFARTDPSGRVVEVAEKKRISNHASTGLYYFTSGKELVEVGDEMIKMQQRTRGEFYVIPVYQKFVERGWRVEVNAASEMWDMGNPEAKAAFERNMAQHGEGLTRR